MASKKRGEEIKVMDIDKKIAEIEKGQPVKDCYGCFLYYAENTPETKWLINQLKEAREDASAFHAGQHAGEEEIESLEDQLKACREELDAKELEAIEEDRERYERDDDEQS